MKNVLTFDQVEKQVFDISNSIRKIYGFEKCYIKAIRTILKTYVKTYGFTYFYINIKKDSGEIYFSLNQLSNIDWIIIKVENHIMMKELSCTIC